MTSSIIPPYRGERPSAMVSVVMGRDDSGARHYINGGEANRALPGVRRGSCFSSPYGGVRRITAAVRRQKRPLFPYICGITTFMHTCHVNILPTSLQKCAVGFTAKDTLRQGMERSIVRPKALRYPFSSAAIVSAHNEVRRRLPRASVNSNQTSL